MSNAYDIRRARREKERQRALCGETLEDYRRKTERPPVGSHLSRGLCKQTADLFTGLRRGKTTPDLFDQ